MIEDYSKMTEFLNNRIIWSEVSLENSNNFVDLKTKTNRFKFSGRTFDIENENHEDDVDKLISKNEDQIAKGDSQRQSFPRVLDCFKIVWIGEESSSTLTNIMMHYSKNNVFSYNPLMKVWRLETVNVNRNLMKRYYLIEKAKDADIIGIVVGTLAVANYMEILKYLKDMIRKAGKKFYTLVVGKINVPKLANFAEVDLFVLVACPENSLIDSRDFLKPIVTPFELEIALVKGKEWSGFYSSDFEIVLQNRSSQTLDHSNNSPSSTSIFGDGNSNTEGEGVRISLVSGKIKTNPKAFSQQQQQHSGIQLEESEDIEAKNGQIAIRTPMDVTVRAQVSASSVFLERTFQGLQVRLGQDAPHVATQGRSGIAMEYDNESNISTCNPNSSHSEE